MFLQLGRLGLEVALQVLHIALDEDGAVMQVLIFPFTEGVAAELATLGEDIIASRQFSDDTEVGHRALYDAELACLVIEGFGDDEGEVDVAVVVVDSAAAGAAAHQEASVGLKCLHVALREGVLVLSDNNRAAVFP